MRTNHRLLAGVLGTVVALVSTLAPAPLSTPAQAIVGGSEIGASDLAPFGAFSWLVRLEGRFGRCTGSLVHAEWVLTAAHCTEIAGDTGITAFVGDDTTGVAVSEMPTDPGWDGEFVNDVALMRLATPSERTPVRLPGIDDGLTTGQPLMLAGWGLTTAGSEIAPTSPSMGVASIDALGPRTVRTDGVAVGCDGDSGGPMVADDSSGRPTVVGIISNSPIGCIDSTSGPRVAAYGAWIQEYVNPGNQPPTVLSGTVEAEAGDPVEVRFLFSDPDGEAVSISDVEFDRMLPPGDGDCVGPSLQDFTCTLAPQTAFVGTTVVTYTVRDVGGLEATGSWVITYLGVIAPPVVDDLAITATTGRAVTFDLPATDPAGSTLTFTIVDGPDHGDLDGCPSGTCTYTAAPDYGGEDEFTFRASNGTVESSLATVTIEVIPNRAPVAESAVYQISSGTVTELPLLASDENGDALTFTVTDGPTLGTLGDCSSGFCTYTPPDEFVGETSFRFVASDGEFTSAPATVTLHVLANLPPVAGHFGTTTKAGKSVATRLADVTFDPEDDPITYAVESGPDHGTLTDCISGVCTYTPDPGFTGTDSFTYTASDATGTSDPATVTIEVIGSSWTVTPFPADADPGLLAAVVAAGSRYANASLTGTPAAVGTFDGAEAVFGIDSGILLSTGRVVDALGPNSSGETGTDHDQPGDADLTTPERTTFDAATIRFDLTDDDGDGWIEFRYVLASEEYSDGGYVVAGFDDAALISIGGQPCRLPGDAPLSVRSINTGQFVLDENFEVAEELESVNADLYLDNPPGSGSHDTELDGFSTVQSCSIAVTPGATVPVKIAIADGGDPGIDTVLLVEGILGTGDVDHLELLTTAVAGLATSLEKKVQNLTAALDAGRIRSACGLLGAFMNEVDAKAGGSIPDDAATRLTDHARALADSLLCEP